MDISKNYMKMCEEAEEIQRLWEFKAGDFYFAHFENSKNPNIICASDIIGVLGLYERLPHKAKYICLPRQDELQELVGIKTVSDFEESDLLAGWDEGNVFVNFLPSLTKYETWSMEQLWLSFVMKKKYNKIWDGKEWVIE